MIGIIDYGMGNLGSVKKAFEYLDIPTAIISDAKGLKNSSALVLPGVGAFGDAMENLNRSGMIETLLDEVKKGKPFLGICLGLQLLFLESEEDQGVKGLDLVPGLVKRFEGNMKIPHVGWNSVRWQKDSLLFKGIPSDSYFYFVHSYYVIPSMQEVISAQTTYSDISFTAAVEQENTFAVQFHPEKSGEWGLAILKNFGELMKR